MNVCAPIQRRTRHDLLAGWVAARRGGREVTFSEEPTIEHTAAAAPVNTQQEQHAGTGDKELTESDDDLGFDAHVLHKALLLLAVLRRHFSPSALAAFPATTPGAAPALAECSTSAKHTAAYTPTWPAAT